MKNFQPEGNLIVTAENAGYLKSPSALREAMILGKTLEARATVCDSEHNLIVDLQCMKGIIPRTEGAIGISEGTTRDIALISRVNKPVCFKVLRIETKDNNQYAVLSRRMAQEECYERYISGLRNGDIINARVTHLEQFGAFVDIGCGIPSLIPIDAISVSRISHPSDRFSVGQYIKAVVNGENDGKICLTHKELLGTWQQNADLFSAGETVAGTVRSIEEYGIFIELMPNLAGLAEPRENVQVGQNASVYIKALIPEKMKVKLIIVDVFDGGVTDKSLKYFVMDKHIDRWKYDTEGSAKNIETIFDN